MFPSHSLLVHHRPAFLPSVLDAIISFNTVGALGLHKRRCYSCSRKVHRSFPVIGAAGREEAPPFEVDRDKAREALQQLDQQLENLAQQQALPKKKRPSPPAFDPNLERDLIMGRTEDMPEFSGSSVAYTTVALVLLTVLNNILFNVFIKPSVDGNEQITEIKRVPLVEPTQQTVPQLVD
ncbi:hypothetical protein Cni_G16437 [Canna indica]|uniref:Uncharacterized protein n=1 Tax=Canna indica TaxID=4628 RepID=A0AAQ3KFA4_9LILI|nr:hypothetical protein Cni_G16437 [Canna indica]